MKFKHILSAIAVLVLSSTAAFAQCNYTSSFGSATASGSTGATVTITTCQFGGEYATISGIVAGNTYRFTSSVASDFVTVRSLTPGGSVVSFAVQGTNWVAPVSGTYYAHFSTNSSCGTASSCRTTTVVTVTGAGASGCLHTSSFGSATINPSGGTVTISTCSFAGEYSTVFGAVAGQTLRFTSSVGSDYITVRSGSPSGPIVAQGTTPLVFVNTFTGTLYPHWSLSSACGTSSTCRTTTVQCTSCTPSIPNDACAGSILVSVPSTTSGSTVGATPDSEPACGLGTASNGVWYRFVGTGGIVDVNTCTGTSYDSQLAVYTGACGALTCIAGNDDNCGLSSRVTLCTSAGTVYYVRVFGFSTASGTFGLTITPGTAVVTISSLTPTCLGGASQSLFGTPAGGTFSGPGVSGSTFNPAAAGVGTHTITYTFCGTSASTTVTVSAPPSNDLCANALTAGVGSFSGSTTCATPDAGLSYCGTSAFSSGSAGSVWYKLVGTGGYFTVSTCNAGTNYDTQLGVYTGACGALTCIAGNDDIGADGGSCSTGPGTAVFKSRVRFCTTPGVNYYILVHGFSTASGNYQIDVTSTAPIAVSPVANTYACGYNVSCAGACDGSIVAFGSGGTAPYSYSWSTGATGSTVSGLCAGTYSVTVTDANGCSSSNSVTLTAPAAVTVNAGPNATVIYGYPSPMNCTTLNATGIGGGCGPYTISWSNGATTASTTVCPSVTTDYTVTVTDANGCTASDVVRVCVVDVRCGSDLSKIAVCHYPPGNPAGRHTICIGYPAVDNHLSLHGDDLGPCGAIDAVCADAPAMPRMAAAAANMTAAPNPFTTTTSIQFTLGSSDNASLKVYDLQGALVATLFEGNVNGGEVMTAEFGSSDLAAGIYMARLVTNGGEVQTVKLVIQK
jgi:hypothetical protein